MRWREQGRGQGQGYTKDYNTVGRNPGPPGKVPETLFLKPFKTFKQFQFCGGPPFKNVHALSKNLSFSHCSLHSIQRIAKAGALARTGTSAKAKGPGFWRQAGDHSGGRREKKDYNMKTPNLKLTFLGDGAYGRERGPGPGLNRPGPDRGRTWAGPGPPWMV